MNSWSESSDDEEDSIAINIAISIFPSVTWSQGFDETIGLSPTIRYPMLVFGPSESADFPGSRPLAYPGKKHFFPRFHNGDFGREIAHWEFGPGVANADEESEIGKGLCIMKPQLKQDMYAFDRPYWTQDDATTTKQPTIPGMWAHAGAVTPTTPAPPTTGAPSASGGNETGTGASNSSSGRRAVLQLVRRSLDASAASSSNTTIPRESLQNESASPSAGGSSSAPLWRAPVRGGRVPPSCRFGLYGNLLTSHSPWT